MKPIRLVALDIDGVLTDGTARLTTNGDAAKRFSFHDLDGVTALHRAGIDVALVTGEDNEYVDLIARRFRIETIVRAAKDKVAAVFRLAHEMKVDLKEVCFVGDSDRDAPAMAMVGLGLAPADATQGARASAHRVLSREGGRGAVAEAAQIVLDLRAATEEGDAAHGEVERILSSSIEAHRRMLDRAVPVLARIAREIRIAFASGRKVLLFGNGGSAADAQHIAGELVGRFAQESEPWPAIALTTDTSVLTCTGNDWEFAEVFCRQVRAHARPGDVVAGISTSGRSENVLRGLVAARERGAVTVGFSGSRPGPIEEVAEICFCAPSDETPRIQELHILAWHVVCELVERALVAEGLVDPR